MRAALEALRVNLADIFCSGRPRREPSALTHYFKSTDGRTIARCLRQFAHNRLASQVGLFYIGWRKLQEFRLLLWRRRSIDARVIGHAKFIGQLLHVHPRIFTGYGGDFRRQQIHDRAILVCGPDCSISPQKTCSRAFLAAKTEGAVEQTWYEPLKPDRHLAEFATKLPNDMIDQTTADQGFPNR